MVILGLGSNIGDRLTNLRLALNFIKNIPNLIIKQVSPVYSSDALLPENAPASWDMPHLNLAIRCETTLNPYELLAQTKQIERQLGHCPEKSWGPRTIDVDILAWDDLIQYDNKLHIPHENLHERPFALWPLSDVAPFWIYPLPGINQGKTAAEMVAQWGSRLTGKAPLHTKQIQQRVDTSQLVGILNITPNSFSDGGKFSTVDSALIQLTELVNAGADIIDIGAEATGPNATPISAREEWQRLEPILSAFFEQTIPLIIQPKISIDTYHPETVEKALALGVNWINDVSGLTNPAMQKILGNHSCDVVIMHHLGIPANQQTIPLNQNIVTTVYQWAENHLLHLEKNGIARNRMIFDVGIGYGKTPEQSLELLKNSHYFDALGVRLLVGHSRKSFLQQFTTKVASERDVETVGLSLYLAEKDIDYLRVHNVDAHARGFKTAAAFITR